MREKVPVSVVIITKNEEANIKETLESVGWADEVILVDDESADRTVEIAKRYTDRIFFRKMDVEGIHRNWAYAQARNTWVLSLDADEKVTPELALEIGKAISSERYVAYDMPLRNFISDHWVRYGGWYPAPKVRLFRKDKFKYEAVEVHPKAFIDGECGHLKADIIHKGYPDIEHFMNSVNRQSTLEALKWVNTGRDMTLGHSIRRSLDRFFRRYVRKAGHKDGMYGFVVAFFDTLYQILSYVKYREMLQKRDAAASHPGQEKHLSVCPVCENKDWKNVYRIGRWDIGECCSCGFARIDPMPCRELRPGFYSEERVTRSNAKKRTVPQRLFRSLKRILAWIGRHDKGAIFYDKLSRSLAAGSKILDLGCGDGSFLKLAKKSFLCTGVEISEYLAGLARERGDIKVISGDFMTMDAGREKYDGVTLISLLEHLDDPGKAVRKCFDLLNRDGVLLIKTINYGCLNRMIRKGRWTGFRPPDHMVYFTSRTLKRLLEKADFVEIKVSSWPLNDNMYCEARRRS